MVPLIWTVLRLSQDVIGLVSCRLLGSFRVEECVVGGSFVEGCVGPFRVVEPNPVLDNAFGLEAVLQFMQIDGPLFERAA